MTTRIALLLLLITGSSTASASVAPVGTTTAEVLNIRVGRTPERTRVVFDLSEPAAYQLVTLNDPARVVVELPYATSRFDPNQLALQGTPIGEVSTDSAPSVSLRYVFKVASAVEPNLFALKPHQNHGHRLVLDLYRSEINATSTSESTEQRSAALAMRKTDGQRQASASPQSATKISNPVGSGASGEWTGSLSLESRLFFHNPAYPEQDKQNISAAFEPEYYRDWSNGSQLIAFRPFFRYDANDSERTQADIRELYWRLEYQQFAVKAGIDVVFWGVIESKHLVDIINQTDLVENIDGEDKLGQPMLNLDYMSENWGTWQAYILPYFRERTFPGEQGRLRTQPVVDTNGALYDSSDEQKHIDFALRWSHYIGDWDIGLAHFSGTSREPNYRLAGTSAAPTLLPLYLQIEQTSLDLQATKGAWLWKLEAFYNSNPVEDYYATSAGFEYTFFGIADSAADLGWLLEYHYDERGENPLTPLQNDIFAGFRLTRNDINSTRLLAGVIVDTDSQSTFGNIEAVRRLGESWTITLEARLFGNIDKADPLRSLAEDDYLELQLSRYF